MTPEESYHATAASIEGAAASQMFGKHCYKAAGGGKPFVSFFQECMVFKLEGDAHREALGLPGAQLFDPSGKHRPMREWVQVPHDQVTHWQQFAGAAHGYVGGLKG